MRRHSHTTNRGAGTAAACPLPATHTPRCETRPLALRSRQRPCSRRARAPWRVGTTLLQSVSRPRLSSPRPPSTAPDTAQRRIDRNRAVDVAAPAPLTDRGQVNLPPHPPNFAPVKRVRVGRLTVILDTHVTRSTHNKTPFPNFSTARCPWRGKEPGRCVARRLSVTTAIGGG